MQQKVRLFNQMDVYQDKIPRMTRKVQVIESRPLCHWRVPRSFCSFPKFQQTTLLSYRVKLNPSNWDPSEPLTEDCKGSAHERRSDAVLELPEVKLHSCLAPMSIVTYCMP